MEADLRASGLPSVTVQITTPPAAPFALNEDADWSSTTIDTLAPFLSSNPFQPAPVARITVDHGPGAPLQGIVEPPGSSTYTTSVADLPKLELAAWEAMKHALAQNATLAGLRLDLRDGVAITSSELIAAPQQGAYSPSQSATLAMSQDAVRQQVVGDLPVWAKAAQVTVVEDYVGERILQMEASLPITAFATVDVSELLTEAAGMQRRLEGQGAKIGRVLVRVTDSATGDPLYTAAADPLFGAMYVSWYSPRVRGIARGLVGPEPRGIRLPVAP
jgi:hypothetical protein